MIRLDKQLAKLSGLSRSEAGRAIRRGRVCVGEATVCDPAQRVDAAAALFLDGQPLKGVSGFRYLMLHKPSGYLCAHTGDTHHCTALDLIDLPHADRLSFAGRLDADTTGLVLLSDDGQWIHRIISPRSACAKTYFVELADPIAQEAIDRLETGVMLRSEKKPTLPAHIEPLGPKSCRITLTEGRYHQIKRMFAAVGNRVVCLHREAIGPLRLEGELEEGAWRFLTPEEITAF